MGFISNIFNFDSFKSKEPIEREDNLTNVATRLGVPGQARNPASSFVDRKLSDGELTNIYVADGFGKKVVDIYANNMTREWFKLAGDSDNLINQKYLIPKLHAQKIIKNALQWSRLYGSSIVIMLINDGRELSEPVNTAAIRTIAGLRVVDRTRLSVKLMDDWYLDPELPNYNTPKIYTVAPPRLMSGQTATAAIITTTGQTVATYRVHESRILRFDGEDLPETKKVNNAGWGDSVFTSIYNQLRNLGQAFEYSAEIMHDFANVVLKIKNLSDLLQIPEGVSKVVTRMENLNYIKSVVKALVIDADGEALEKLTTSIAGLPDLLDRFSLALAAVTGIPEVILMGRSPSGLNASGDSDVRAWYDSIKNEQTEVLTPQLNKLLTYVLAARDSPLKGKTVDDLDLKYNPLWQLSESEEIKNRNLQAQSDGIYVENGIVSSSEIAISRFGQDQYSYETQLTEGMRDNNGDTNQPKQKQTAK